MIVVTWISVLLFLTASQTDCETASQEVIGFVDRTLVLKLLNLVRRNPTATAAELYRNCSGLYLLNRAVSTQGKVSSVCAFGYSNVDFQPALSLPNTTQIDLTTSVRLYVYIVLLRKLPNTTNQYWTVYPPAVLHHDLNEDCLGVSNGLDWSTEPGDRVGMFIPDSCVLIEDLEGVFVADELRNSRFIRMLCPSQPNLLPNFPSFGTYVTNSSAMGIEHFISAQTVSGDNFVNMSVFLNMNITISPQEQNISATDSNGTTDSNFCEYN